MTTNKNLATPAHGSDVNTWDVPLNSNFNIIDGAFGGVLHINVTSLTSTPIPMTNGVSDTYSYINPIIILSGTLTANVTFVVPSGIGGEWIVVNNSTGAFTITFSSGGAGTSVQIPQGSTKPIYSDGTNVNLSVVTALASNSVTNTLLAQAGAFTLKGNPTGSTANVQDASLTTYLDTISSTQGSILYRDVSAWHALGPGSLGQVLSTAGIGANPLWAPPSAIPNVIVYSTPGSFTFTVPTGITKIHVTNIAAGGGGGGGTGVYAGGGAGGGGIAIGIITGLTGGFMISGFVGAGGTTYNTGGTTTFGAYLSAIGGGGGNDPSGGVGGTASGGYLNITGSAGNPGVVAGPSSGYRFTGGSGGSSYGGGGIAGNAGNLGGGGGGYGGTGGNGAVIIYY